MESLFGGEKSCGCCDKEGALVVERKSESDTGNFTRKNSSPEPLAGKRREAEYCNFS